MWKGYWLKGILLFLLLAFSVLAPYVGTLPLTRLTPSWGRMGYFDWPIFIEAATHFLQSGVLYYADLERYAPNAEIYKFPPLFASALIVFLRLGLEAETLRVGVGTLQLLMYFASIWLCLRISNRRLSFYLCACIFLFVATFEPFINNFIGLQIEAFILFLLCLMLWSLVREKPLLAGVFLGVAVALKLYPLFLLGIVICINQRIRFLAGVAMGLMASLVFTMLVIGVEQNWLFFSRIAPALAMEVLDTHLRNISINNLFFQMGGIKSYAHYAGIVLMLGSLGVLATTIKRSFQPRIIIAGFSLMVAVLVLGIRNSWGNYQLLLVLPIIILFAEATRSKAMDYISIACIIIACSLIFISPPHRLYFLAEKLFGLEDIPIVQCFVFLRATAGLIIILLCLGLFWRAMTEERKNRTQCRAPQY